LSLHLILGGARSGKSAYAQRLAEGLSSESGQPLVFVATAEAHDAEMQDRIVRHQAERDARWRTVEAPLDLESVLGTLDRETVLLDCLTLWLTNSMLAQDGAAHGARLERLPSILTAREGATVVVSNEVGLGIVPDTALARRFRDEAGRLNQAVAAAADAVVFMAAGLPLTLKPAP
jgi:adenosylcobinamide kinase / adenosylcobinamide-phosphate guanylyltransferase